MPHLCQYLSVCLGNHISFTPSAVLILLELSPSHAVFSSIGFSPFSPLFIGGIDSVVEKFGSSLIVKLLYSRNVRRHMDHVRLSTCDVTGDVSGPSEPFVKANTWERPANIIPEGNTPEESCREPFQGAPAVEECEPPPPVAPLEERVLHRSSCLRRPPNRLDL